MTKVKSQLDRFKEAARESGTDDNEERFNEKLRKLVKDKRKRSFLHKTPEGKSRDPEK